MSGNPRIDRMGICYEHISYGCGRCEDRGRDELLAAWEACGGAGLPANPLISRRLAAGFYTPPSDDDWFGRFLTAGLVAFQHRLEADFFDEVAEARYARANSAEPRWFEGIR